MLLARQSPPPARSAKYRSISSRIIEDPPIHRHLHDPARLPPLSIQWSRLDELPTAALRSPQQRRLSRRASHRPVGIVRDRSSEQILHGRHDACNERAGDLHRQELKFDGGRSHFPIRVVAHSHRCPRQYRSQRSAYPSRAMAQETSPDFGEAQNAAVRLPPAPPADRQRIVGPVTNICPVERVPVCFPTSLTRWSREARGSADGQGWPWRHVPSISRAAMPDKRMCGPSAHQIGPSPS